MDLLHCRYCDSNLVNLIGVKIKHDIHADRNISIQKEYMNIKEPDTIKFFLRCYGCSKISESKVENKRGCTIISHKKIDNNNPQNEIIDGGRFN